jgi:hypothetical protein
MALADVVVRLQETTTILSEHVKNLKGTVAAVEEAHAKTAQQLAGLRAEYDKEVALLKQRIETTVALLKAEHERELALLKREIEDWKSWKADHKKQTDEWARRLWAFGPNILAAILGGLIAAAVNYFVPHR